MGDGQRHEDPWNLLANQSGFVGEFSASWKVVVGVSHQNKAKTKQNKGTKEEKEEGKGKKKRRGGCCLGPAPETDCDLHVYATHKCTYTSGLHMYSHTCPLPSTHKNKTFKKSHQFHYKSNEWAMKPNLTLWVRLVHEASHCLSLQKSRNGCFSPLFCSLSTSCLLFFFLEFLTMVNRDQKGGSNGLDSETTFLGYSHCWIFIRTLSRVLSEGNEPHQMI